MFGTYVTSKLEEVEGKTTKVIATRQKALLKALLEGKSGYADPVLRKAKKE